MTVRFWILQVELPGTGKGGPAHSWIPGPERRVLVALDALRRMHRVTPTQGGASSPSPHAQRLVAQAARSHAPGSLIDATAGEVIDDPALWVASWRARGAPVTLLVRVPEVE
jgi:hypothetical protein